MSELSGSEFWDWAVAAYARPAVAEACLDLQDRYGQNVPLLLWAAWRGGDIARAVEMTRTWEADVVAPLRGVRRRLKGYSGAEALRTQVKTAELDAERILMQQLETVSGEEPAELRAIAARWGGEVPDEALARLGAALASGVTNR